MKRKLISILTIFITLFLVSSVFSYEEVKVQDQVPFAYEKITVTTLAVSRLTAAYRNVAGAIFLTVEDNAIRYRIDGDDPDINDGHLILAATYQNLWTNNEKAIKEFRMIAIDDTAVVLVTYYRKR